jgi:hypothetical protein
LLEDAGDDRAALHRNFAGDADVEGEDFHWRVLRPILAEVLALGVGAFYQMRVGEKRLGWVRAGEIFSRVVASPAREHG